MAQNRQLTLFELLTIIVVIWCGGFLGAGIAKLVGLFFGGSTSDSVAHGGLIGGAATFCLLILWSWWFRRMDRIHPPCKCGKSNWEDFESGHAEGFRNIWQCSCGKKYSRPKWQLWFEITDNGTARLYMTRNYFRQWREATKREIARQSPEITRARARN